jgi:hypothetical protein
MVGTVHPPSASRRPSCEGGRQGWRGVLRENQDRLPGAVTFTHDSRLHPRASDDRLAKTAPEELPAYTAVRAAQIVRLSPSHSAHRRQHE